MRRGLCDVADYPLVFKASEMHFSLAVIQHKMHPVLTRKDRMGSRVERVRFGWTRGKLVGR